MVEEKEVLLTAREFDVLAVMARHPGRVYTYTQICRMIYGETGAGEETYSSAYCLILQPAEEAGERSTASSVSSYRIWCRVSV